MKSINRFIYKDPGQVGLNTIFGNRNFGWEFELIGLLIFVCFWMPVALLLFASFESAVYFLIVMATICPIILNTTIGVLNINPQWIKMVLTDLKK